MANKCKDGVLPIEFDGWDPSGDHGDTMYYGVVFLEDFGPFKRGERVDCLDFTFSNGLLEELKNDGGVVRSLKVKLVPV